MEGWRDSKNATPDRLSLVSRMALSREERMEFGHALDVRQEPCRRLSREGMAVVHQMHLIVEVVIVGDAAPPTARRSELVVQSSVKSDDSSVEFRRHADLRKETPLELSW
jgi:hypothetical protein